MTPKEKAAYIRQYFSSTCERDEAYAYQVSRWISKELVDLFNKTHNAPDKVVADKLRDRVVYWKNVKQELLKPD